MLTNGGEGWRVRVCANDCCVAPAPITVLPSMRMRVKWYVCGSLRRSTNTNTLPDIGRTGGADGDGDGEGREVARGWAKERVKPGAMEWANQPARRSGWMVRGWT